MQAKAIPDGYHTITPYLTVTNASDAIEFYQRAFGAQEMMRMDAPDGKVGHAEIRIGDSAIMLSDEAPGMGCLSPTTLKGASSALFLYVDDVDASFERAVDAGAKVLMPVSDMFWGDRYGQVADPFGHRWSLATHKEDLTPVEIRERAAKAFSGGAAAA